MITAGLATFVTVGSVLGERRDTVEVIVLSADAAAGTGALDLPVAFVAVPVDTPFLDTMLRPGDLTDGMALARSASSGSPLTRDQFVESGSGVLTRTATIAVESVAIHGLGLVVGDRVDVVGIDEFDRALFVLTHARVARLPQTSGPEGLLTGPSASYVTVEVDDTQALALVTAQQRGPIELVRSTGAPALSTATRSTPALSTTTEDRP